MPGHRCAGPATAIRISARDDGRTAPIGPLELGDLGRSMAVAAAIRLAMILALALALALFCATSRGAEPGDEIPPNTPEMDWISLPAAEPSLSPLGVAPRLRITFTVVVEFLPDGPAIVSSAVDGPASAVARRRPPKETRRKGVRDASRAGNRVR